MTLAALKKEVLRLPVSQRVKLANAVFESLPAARAPLTFAEREKRAKEALSDSAEVVTSEEFFAGARRLIDNIARDRNKSQRRSAQRG